LERFKEFIENRGAETGAWRGTYSGVDPFVQQSSRHRERLQGDGLLVDVHRDRIIAIVKAGGCQSAMSASRRRSST
jgi:hypothetical protein